MLQIRSADEPMTTCMFFCVCIGLTHNANKVPRIQSTGVVLSLLTISCFLSLHIDVLAVRISGEKISSGHRTWFARCTSSLPGQLCFEYEYLPMLCSNTDEDIRLFILLYYTSVRIQSNVRFPDKTIRSGESVVGAH